MKMKVYKCELRLGGNVMQTVSLADLTGLELKFLRKTHGDDAIVNLKQTGEKEVASEHDEIMRIAQKYGLDKVSPVLNVNPDDFEDWTARKELEALDSDEAASIKSTALDLSDIT